MTSTNETKLYISTKVITLNYYNKK